MFKGRKEGGEVDRTARERIWRVKREGVVRVIRPIIIEPGERTLFSRRVVLGEIIDMTSWPFSFREEETTPVRVEEIMFEED